MDFSNINNSLNISYDQQIKSGNDFGSKINLPSQQNNKVNSNQFQQQLKEVSKQEESQETQKTFSEISTRNETITNQNKNNTTETMKNFQQLIQKPETQTIAATKGNILEVLQDTQINKLKQQDKDQKTNLQNKLLGEEKNSSLKDLTLASSVSLFKSWLKKVQIKPGSTEEINDSEEIDESVFSDDSNQDNNLQKAKQIKNCSLVKQQKLFSLNMQASLRYLKNLKTFNNRYSPEMLIYNEETGYVDAKETLECLGWDNVEQFKTQLNKELNLNKIKEIHNNDKILNAADNSGINVYKATHPLHNNKMTVAIESLTGEITMIEQLQDLEKLELQGKVYKIYNVSN